MDACCAGVTVGCRYTMNSMPPLNRLLAFCTPCCRSRAEPNSISETTTVSTDARVSVTLRTRLLPVSRMT